MYEDNVNYVFLVSPLRDIMKLNLPDLLLIHYKCPMHIFIIVKTYSVDCP